MTTGDRVQYTDYALRAARDYALDLGRSHPRFPAAEAEWHRQRDMRRTIVHILPPHGSLLTTLATAHGYRIRWDNGILSETLAGRVRAVEATNGSR